MSDLALQVRASAPAASPAADLLSVVDLAAGYDHRDVVRAVNLGLPSGTAVRVSGRNGSGKTTLLRCLAGAQPIRVGRVAVAGFDLERQPAQAKSHLGYSDGSCPFPYLTGREHLLLARRVYRFPASWLDELLDPFPSWACRRALDAPVRTYSRGMRQQLSLLLATAHRPGLLLLDESTDGLDDEALSDWTGFLHAHVAAGGGAVFVEHRDPLSNRLPSRSTSSLVLTESLEASDG